MRDILSWLTFSNACVAQLVEQRIRNAQVAGSSPAGSSTEKPAENVWFQVFSGFESGRKLHKNPVISPEMTGFLLLFGVLDFAEPASLCLFGVYAGVYNCR